MRILAIGDQHFKLDNISQVEVFISKLKDHLEQEHYDLIVSGGDLLDTHERLHTQCLNKAIEYLKLLSTHSKTYVLVGNHDMINPSQFLTTNHWLNVIKEWDKTKYNIEIVDTPMIYNGDYKLVFCPFVPDGMFTKALDTLESDWKDASMIFGHQTMDGVKMGSIEADGVEKWQEEYPNLVCFHVHDMQKVQDNLFYTGACMQHSFSENIKKSLMQITITERTDELDEVENNLVFFNKNVYIRRLNVGVPIRKIIHCSVKDLEKMTCLDDVIPRVYRSSMFILKVVVSGNYNEFKLIKKTEHIKKLMSKYKLIFKQDVTSVIEKDEIKLNYNREYAFKNMFEDILKKEIGDDLYALYEKL